MDGGRSIVVLAMTLALLGGARPAGAQEAVRPVAGAVVKAFVPPEHAYSSGHRGVDLAAAPGEQVRAALAGTVAFAGHVAGEGWVTLDHGDALETTYGVLVAGVRQGQTVAAGDVLGTIEAGRAHLDWGAKRGDAYLDPLTLLGGWRARLVDPDALRPAADGPPTLLAPVLDPREPSAQGGLLWPVPGRVTSGFGPRTHPLSGERRLHAGVDVAAPSGTPIVAAADGVVTAAGPAGGYGLLVEVDHGGGLATRYAHASVLLVRPGDQVQRGQVLARVGSTGASTGPHLHFEVRVDGRPQDPLRWFPP